MGFGAKAFNCLERPMQIAVWGARYSRKCVLCCYSAFVLLQLISFFSPVSAILLARFCMKVTREDTQEACLGEHPDSRCS